MKYAFTPIACMLFSLLSCTPRNGQSLPFPSAGRSGSPTVYCREEWMRSEVRTVLAGMSLSEKASQVLMTGIDGKDRFAPHLYRHFDGAVPGAVLLFAYNVAETPLAFARYLDSCNDAFITLGAPVPVIFAIDHEGGDVYRTGRLTTRLPSARDVASRLSPLEAEELYRASGTQLSLLGIHLNLAPVIELLTAANSDFLGTRSFSADPSTARSYSAAAVNGYRAGGIQTVLKHFPGNAGGDPHTGLPLLDVSRKDFDTDFLEPFRTLLTPESDAVLVSHLTVSAVDPGVPFCLSPAGVTGILRDGLGFDGLVLTDDISMDAIARSGRDSGTAAVLALAAGCDMVMTSDPDIRSIADAIKSEAERNEAFARRLDEAVLHILEAKFRAGLVKTAHERYSDSRASGTSDGDFRFDQSAFDRAKTAGDRILEESRDN